ncbi:DNA polymerase alpha primase subunit [Cavenderia fasciculata]|uniref:DNA primase n=1 Tax=Cavenderia fasciculata TaxID=261658 RepID=F4PUG2_CACFS|nr:DNA polymerase alpha primase subunit [Cavenderia fasciculata]EGG21034.1 DNA polymerase alpha primase subunit [Cavenderia fasciculata]|eukprot:XP_004358884.1 DNA polymerase alpha primase subunit [Cavenderia fasciculata]
MSSQPIVDEAGDKQMMDDNNNSNNNNDNNNNNNNEQVDDDFQFDFDDTTNTNKLYADKVKYRAYLDTIFPWDILYEWLTASHSSRGEDEVVYFSKREFSVSSKGINYKTGKEQEFWNRHKSFTNIEELKPFAMGRIDEVRQKADVPEKLDIGAVYNHEPSRMGAFMDYRPVCRELVFDIDSNDYDEVRTCCKGNTLCPKCWRLLAAAIRMLQVGLRDSFGFEHFMPIFSGGRGVHLWVCDPNAMMMTEDMRRAVLGYFRLSDQSPVSPDDMHPIAKDLFDNIFLPLFQDHLLEDQQILSDDKQIEAIRSIMPATFKIKTGDAKKKVEFSPRDIINQILDKSSLTVQEKWKSIYDTFDKNSAFELIYKIVIHFSAPRLDEAVTVGVNHLLKSPFCIHPRTRIRLCVPISLKEIETFNPDTVPTLEQLTENPTIINKFRSIFKNFVNNLRNQQKMDTDAF